MIVFLGHKGSLEVPAPGVSQGRPPGIPGACPGVPGAFPVVPGACPGDLRDPRGLYGCPGHRRDPFNKDDSII